METRIKSGAIFLGAVAVFLGCSHIPWARTLMLALLSAGILGELGRAWKVERMGWLRFFGLATGALLSLVSGKWMLLPVTALLMALVLVCWGIMGRLPGERKLPKWQQGVICLSLLVLLASTGALRQRTWGLWELLLAMFVCVATDSFAYLVGRKFGRHPLAPGVSPKKTLEGAAGGTLGALAVTLALCVILEGFGLFQVRHAYLAIHVLWTSMVGQYGDLCLSALKRTAGIKDFGDLLPGHGGLLDRLDSHLLAVPFTYVIFTCCGSVFYGG